MSPDTDTTTGHQVPMRCADCKCEFHGVERNLIRASKRGEGTFVECLCDNCLKELGETARA